MEERRKWVIECDDRDQYDQMLKEVKDGDIVTMGNTTWVWLDVWDRPQEINKEVERSANLYDVSNDNKLTIDGDKQ